MCISDCICSFEGNLQDNYFSGEELPEKIKAFFVVPPAWCLHNFPKNKHHVTNLCYNLFLDLVKVWLAFVYHLYSPHNSHTVNIVYFLVPIPRAKNFIARKIVLQGRASNLELQRIR